MTTDMPKYMKDVLKYPIGQNGVVSSILPVSSLIVTLGSGWLADLIIKRKWLSVTNTRKFFMMIASVGPSATMISGSYAGCDRTTVVVLFTLTMGFVAADMAGLRLNDLDLSPNYAGTVMAIKGGVAGITAILTPYLIGVLTPNVSGLMTSIIFVQEEVNKG